MLTFGLVNAGVHERHEFGAEIRGVHAGADVHMIAAEAHFAEYLRLTHQLVLFEAAVP